MLHFDILTIFPSIFDSYFAASILKRAQEKKQIKINIYNLRDWAKDKHHTVDDRPYGGGPGMIMKIDVLYKAIQSLKKKNLPCTLRRSFLQQRRDITQKVQGKFKKIKVILFSPDGKQFDQKMAKKFSALDRVILVCGRYEGFDARIYKFIDEIISVGPYVLTGGEIPAMAVVDATTRLIKGVIREESLLEESCSEKFIGEYPQYTRPGDFTYLEGSGRIKHLKVPKVLLSGDQKKISEWKQRKV